ncbi:MAG: NADH-quinone oxidoreductase subunit L [Acidobacteriota bacterium]|nr:NADH-quinone oxidoreductase subunit L [Acidobacteriota bacterium]
MTIPWLTAGGRHLVFGFRLTRLPVVMALLVGTVSLVVFVYALRYMKSDARAGRFFAILTLFVAAMLALVLSADLVTLFMAWEVVGICSYLLIGFWFEKPEIPPAATIAFVTTRVGDAALLAGFLLLIVASGSSDIDTVLAMSNHLPHSTVITATFLIFIGAASKSAQIPFQSWLPDAMVGPTPVSALLHSATMVAAGVFLVARLYPLFAVAPAVLTVMAWTGALSALYGGVAALVAKDLKRALAYSTISQLGLMYAGLGSGSLFAGVVLLIAQAFYKATLFLSAGVVDHVAGGTDLEGMGGLRRATPITFVAFAISAAALAGLPVTLALPAKDATLAAAWHLSKPLFFIVIAASLLTALYSARLLAVVFLGDRRGEPRSSEDRGLALPAMVLAIITIAGLAIDSPLLGRPLEKLLGVKTMESGGITLVAIAIAAAGFSLGLIAQRRWSGRVVWPPMDAIARAAGYEFGLRPATMAVASVTVAGTRVIGWFDSHAIDSLPVRVAVALRSAARRAAAVDRAVFDRAADLAAAVALKLVRATRSFDLRAIDELVHRFGEVTLRAGDSLRKLQTGRIENYLLMIYAWFFAVVVTMVLVMVL